MNTLAFDSKAFATAYKAGHGPALLEAIVATIGVESESGWSDWMARDEMGRLAQDAQSQLVTVSNAGIPAWLSNYLDPKLIEVLVAPMRAAEFRHRCWPIAALPSTQPPTIDPWPSAGIAAGEQYRHRRK